MRNSDLFRRKMNSLQRRRIRAVSVRSTGEVGVNNPIDEDNNVKMILPPGYHALPSDGDELIYDGNARDPLAFGVAQDFSPVNANQIKIVKGNTHILLDSVTGDVTIKSGAGSIVLKSNGTLVCPNMPTTNPGIAGALWSDGGFIKLSS